MKEKNYYLNYIRFCSAMVFTAVLLVLNGVHQHKLYAQQNGEAVSSITLATSKAINEAIPIQLVANGNVECQGATLTKLFNAVYHLTVTNPDKMVLTGDIVRLGIPEGSLKKVEFSNCKSLVSLIVTKNELTSLDLTQAPNINTIYAENNNISGQSMHNLVTSLPNYSSGSIKGKLVIANSRKSGNEKNECTKGDVSIATEKGWQVLKCNDLNGVEEPYQGIDGKKFTITIKQPAEGGGFYIEGYGYLAKDREVQVEEGSLCHVGVHEQPGFELTAITLDGKDITQKREFKATKDVVLTGTFKKLTFPVNISSNAFGTIEVEGYTSEMLKNVPYNTELNILVKPNNELCSLKNLLVNNHDINPSRIVVVKGITNVQGIFERSQGLLNDEQGIILSTNRANGNSITIWGMAQGDVQFVGANARWQNAQNVRVTLNNNQVTIVGKFTAFKCDNNDLVSLDISKAPNLELLQCHNNGLTVLDVTNNTQLTELNCSVNQLLTINLANQSKLKRLDCYQNKISDNGMTSLIESLHGNAIRDKAIYLLNSAATEQKETNTCTNSQIVAAIKKGWKLFDLNGSEAGKKELTESEGVMHSNNAVVFLNKVGNQIIIEGAKPHDAVAIISLSGEVVAQNLCNEVGSMALPVPTYMTQLVVKVGNQTYVVIIGTKH